MLTGTRLLCAIAGTASAASRVKIAVLIDLRSIQYFLFWSLLRRG